MSTPIRSWSERWVGFARPLIQLLVPIVLILTNVRLLMTETFLRIEYATPGFPADRYGFTTVDRLRWAPLALEYLLNDADTEFLGDLRFGDGTPLYNERELRHMDDVKRLSRTALRVWGAASATLILLVIGLWAQGRRGEALGAISAGGLLTLGGMVILALGLALSFSTVFVGFHRVFFEGDTWLFLYSDTLIRLFPERFWRDAFLFIAGATLVEAVVLRLGATRLGRALNARPGPTSSGPMTGQVS